MYQLLTLPMYLAFCLPMYKIAMKARHHTMSRLLLNSLIEKGLILLCFEVEIVKLYQRNTVIIFHNNHKYHRNIWLSTL